MGWEVSFIENMMFILTMTYNNNGNVTGVPQMEVPRLFSEWQMRNRSGSFALPTMIIIINIIIGINWGWKAVILD